MMNIPESTPLVYLKGMEEDFEGYWEILREIRPPRDPEPEPELGYYLGLLGPGNQEISYEGYQRARINETGDMTFPTVLQGGGTVIGFGIFQQATGGRYIAAFPITNTIAISEGITFMMRSQDLTISGNLGGLQSNQTLQEFLFAPTTKGFGLTQALTRSSLRGFL